MEHICIYIYIRDNPVFADDKTTTKRLIYCMKADMIHHSKLLSNYDYIYRLIIYYILQFPMIIVR